jgi:polyadenylate-binding protein
MKDPQGSPRVRLVLVDQLDPDQANAQGFGFVSFEREEDTAAALAAMNGARIRSQVTGEERVVDIRYHEPKRLRESRQRPSIGSDSVLDLSVDMSQHMSGLVLDPVCSLDAPTDILLTRAQSTMSTPHLRQTSSSSSSSSSVAPSTRNASLSEYDRLFSAVVKLETDVPRARQLTDLIFSLPAKDRALCLFNSSILTVKVGEASHVLDAINAEAMTPSPRRSPETPVRGGSGPMTLPPTPEATPERPAESLAGLARLDSAEIVRRVEAGEVDCGTLGLVPPSRTAMIEIDGFVAGLEGKPLHERKQKIGEKYGGLVSWLRLSSDLAAGSSRCSRRPASRAPCATTIISLSVLLIPQHSRSGPSPYSTARPTYERAWLFRCVLRAFRIRTRSLAQLINMPDILRLKAMAHDL